MVYTKEITAKAGDVIDIPFYGLLSCYLPSCSQYGSG
jgi:hypothetical protein